MTTLERLESMSDWHRSEFVEMLRDHEYRSGTEPRVVIFEWIRLVPAAQRAYELLLQTSAIPFERDLAFLYLSETGRVIVGDGWDYVRIFGFETLAGYHDYTTIWHERSEAEQLALHVSARKVVIVRDDETLRIR